MSLCQEHLQKERRISTGGTGLLIGGILLLIFGAIGIIYSATHYTPEATAAALWGIPSALLGLFLIPIGIFHRKKRRAMDADPEQSVFVATIRRSLPPEQAGLPIAQLFALVDQDLRQGRTFASVTVGQEWVVLVNRAVRVEKIQGIALRKNRRRTSHARMNTYVVSVADGFQPAAEAEFLTREHAMECYKALRSICPAASAEAEN